MLTLNINTPNSNQLASDFDRVSMSWDLIDRKSPSFVDDASEIVSICAKKVKTLEAQRKEITKPLDDAKKATMALFSVPITRYKTLGDEARAALKARVEEINAENERRLLEAKAAEQAIVSAIPVDASDIEREAKEAEAALVTQAATVEVKSQSASFATVKKAKITDFGAFLKYASTHPDFHQYIEIKVGLIERLMKKSGIEVPGIQLVEETQIRAKA